MLEITGIVEQKAFDDLAKYHKNVFYSVNFIGVTFKNIVFNENIKFSCCFGNITIKNSKFADLSIANSNLNLEIKDSNLDNSLFTSSTFKLDFLNVTSSDISFEDCNILNSNITKSKFFYCHFLSNFLNTALYKVEFNNCSFEGVFSCRVRNGTFTLCKFEQVNAANCTLAQTLFYDCKLGYTVFSNSGFNTVTFQQCDTKNACFSQVNLSRTNFIDCLGFSFETDKEEFLRECPLIDGVRIVYRTMKSTFVINKDGVLQEYIPGHTYIAPLFSEDASSNCHPGIYAGSLNVIKNKFPRRPLVKCSVEEGDWIMTNKGEIRCKKLTVLEYVENIIPIDSDYFIQI